MRPVGFLGLSHLGIVSSITLASRGFDVVAYDPDRSVIEALASGNTIVSEPGLADCLASAQSRITWTSTPSEIAKCSVVYIAQDVPTDDDGHSDLAATVELTNLAIANALPGASIVMHSQVPPGTTRSFCVAAEAKGCAMVYQVETLIFGRALERARHPERYIIGLTDASKTIPADLQTVLESGGCPTLTMRFESAELAKIAINTMLVSSIQATDTLTEICELVGADWREIAPSLRLDRRIGEFAYLSPSLGIGGSNLERDLVTVQELARQNGRESPALISTWRTLSDARRDWPSRAIRKRIKHIDANTRIAILGLAYKRDTGSTRNSPGLRLLEEMRSAGAGVVWHDPIVQMSDDTEALRVATPQEAIRDANVIAITTYWPEYEGIAHVIAEDARRDVVVVDPYGVLAEHTDALGQAHYMTIGRGAVHS